MSWQFINCFILVIISVVNAEILEDADHERDINHPQPFRLNKLNMMWEKAKQVNLPFHIRYFAIWLLWHLFRQRLWLRLGVNVDDQLWLRLNPIPIRNCNPSANPSSSRNTNTNVNVNVNVIVVLNANVLRLDEDRRQRRSGISFWT